MEHLYPATTRDVIIATDDVRVVQMTLAGGERIPWHYHTNVVDRFFCLEGELELEFEKPTGGVLLLAGDSAPIESGRPHSVLNPGDKPCKFLLIQGPGEYDFIPVDMEPEEEPAK